MNTETDRRQMRTDTGAPPQSGVVVSEASAQSEQTEFNASSPSMSDIRSAQAALDALGTDRVAMAERLISPWWIDLGLIGAIAVMSLLMWASDFALISTGVFLAGMLLMLVVDGILLSVLVNLQRKRGMGWGAANTPLNVAVSVGLAVCLFAMLAVGGLARWPWWPTVGALAALMVVCFALDWLSNWETRRFIAAGGTVESVFDSNARRRTVSGEELWTMARFRALPDEERRKAAQVVVSPLWFYPMQAIGLLAVSWLVVVLPSMVSDDMSDGLVIQVLVSISVALVAGFVCWLWIRRSHNSARMAPPNRACRVLFGLQIVTGIVLLPLFAGFLVGYSDQPLSAGPPVIPAIIVSLIFILLFSTWGWTYDRKQRDAIAEGC